MCYNCGCGIREDDMGHPANITEETIKKAAAASNQTVEQAKMEMYKLLKEEIEKMQQQKS